MSKFRHIFEPLGPAKERVIGPEMTDPHTTEEIVAWISKGWPVYELVRTTRTEARKRLGLQDSCSEKTLF